MSKTKTKPKTRRRDALAIASAYSRSGPSKAAALPPRSTTLSRGRRQIPAIFDEQPVSLPVDRRVFQFEPEPTRPARRFSGRPARVVVATPSPAQKSRPAALYAPAAVAFQAPARVAVCARRGVRKEVIHATGVAGSRVKKPKPGPFTKVRC